MKSPSTQTPLRVLILEDSEDDALLMVHELQHAGYDVTFERVDTPQFFSAALALESWDVVLADYSLPYFKGYEALELWRKSGSTVPLIFVSGMMSPEIAVGAMKAGAHDYISKNNLGLIVPSIERELNRAEDRRRLNAALKSASEELEKQIDERTQELQRKNVTLTMEIGKHRATQASIRRYLLCLTYLREITEEAGSSLDLQNVMRLVLEKLELVLPETARTVRLFKSETGELDSVAYQNLDEKQSEDPRWQALERSFARLVWESKAPIVVEKLESDPRSPDSELLRNEGFASYLAVPLVARRKTLGLLSFYTKEERKFSEDEVQFLTVLADQAATAIDNSRLAERR
jgi:DNA-binding response OmpR family regulator